MADTNTVGPGRKQSLVLESRNGLCNFQSMTSGLLIKKERDREREKNKAQPGR